MTFKQTMLDITTPKQVAPPVTRIALIVLGMHRSGTSALSGVLARLGCDTPATLMAPDMRNTKGFYESQPISALNDVILASAGTTWDGWSAVSPAWFDSPQRATFSEQALNLVESEFGNSPLIVVKDPRISLLAPLWFDVLRRAGYDVRVVIAYRSAFDVAASLTERNGFDPALGHLIWLRYVLEAERASREVPRVCVRYDRLLSNWGEEVSRIETGLELRLPRQSPQARVEIDEFLAPSMRHHMAGANSQAVDAASCTWTADVHDIFDRWTRQSENSVDRQSLDRIRAEFDSAYLNLDPVICIAKGRVGAEAALKAQLEEVKKALTHSATAANENREALVRAELHIGALEKEIGERIQTAGAPEIEIGTLQAELKCRGEILLNHEREIDNLTHAFADLSRSHGSLRHDHEMALKAARSEKRKSEAALAKANARIDEITNSRSMKLTAFLRRLGSLVAKK